MIDPKIPDEQLKELVMLASERVSEAAMTVLQLIDDPGQAAATATVCAMRMMRLAILFAHTDSVMKDDNKEHHQIVAGLAAHIVAQSRPPTEKELARMRQLKATFERNSRRG